MNNFFEDPLMLEIDELEPNASELEDTMNNLFYEENPEEYDDLYPIDTTEDSFLNIDTYTT